MGVYIKGMEMPTHCTECDFWHDGVFEHCLLNMEVQNEDVPYDDGEYPDGCPLVPVPPHGRLIDADGEIGVNVTMMPGGKCRVDLIAPTVIPAEEGDAHA